MHLEQDALTREIEAKRDIGGVRLWIEDKMSWKVIQIIKSPITGPKGNVEYLLYASK